MPFDLERVDVDGAIREQADAVSGDTRLSFLRKGALAGGAALSGGAILSALVPGTALAASKDRQRPPASFGSGDIGVLNYALTLEFLEATFYAEAVKNKVYGSDAMLERFTKETASDEAKHVAFLTKALGSKAVKKPSFDFGKAVTDKDTFAATSYVLENTGVHAYHGQLTNIKATANLLYAAEIATVEGRHAGAIGLYLGKAVAPKSGFDSPLGAGQVLAAVKATHFIKS
ncbi:MAG TPA: ferritin-like domain-containing protein [Solirubrobacteraceae bacterium]|nr:ferritin-like domain-containing protein [Solirubrobacteraceae bacterium]